MLATNRKLKPLFIALALILLSVAVYLVLKSTNVVQNSSGDDFMKVLKSGATLKELYIKDNYITAVTSKGSYTTPINAINIRDILKKYPVTHYSKSGSVLISLAILILLAILAVLIVMLRKNQSSRENLHPKAQMSYEPKELTQNIQPESIRNISFQSVAGIQDVKEDLEEIIAFLKHPKHFLKYDIRMPKGVLLIGPPGVGKTLIAKAISSEAGVPFFYHSGASFVHIYAGMGARRVKELFAKAKEMSPSIIFIDEIDAVGKSRNSLDSNEREATLNQLLVEMDGFSNNSGVIVIAATNRLDVLDGALLRPGRFDRRIAIGLPDIKERKKIIELYLTKKHHTLDINSVAKLTAGFSPAAIETLINEAALNVLREGKKSITLDDIYLVKNRIIYGKKRVKILSKEERAIESDYQAAKITVATWFGFEFDKVNLSTPLVLQDDTVLVSKTNLLNKAKIYMAGIVYLQQRYRNSFNIAIEDKKMLEEIIQTVATDYTLYKSRNDSLLLENMQEEVESILGSLAIVIEKISNILNEKEIISQQAIKEEFDALL